MKVIKNRQARSAVRTALKVVGTALVSFGVLEAGQIDVVVSALTEIAGAVMVLYGVWDSWRDKKEQE